MDRVVEYASYHWEGLVLILTPIVFSPVLMVEGGDEFHCLFLLLVMAVYWITQVIPLGMTSMLPIALFPLMDIMGTERACMQIFKDSLFMFITSILVSSAIEYSDLHLRIGLRVLKLVGCKPRRLHFGLCMVSMSLSMWVTNSGVTAMMCPIIFAVLQELSTNGIIKAYNEADEALPLNQRRPADIALCYYMSTAFASSIGGCGTLIGTPTNLAFKSIYDSRFPDSTDSVEFGYFMFYSLPICVLATVFMYICMEIYYMGLFRPYSDVSKKLVIGLEGEQIGERVINQKYSELGPMNSHQIQVAILFLVLALLYVFRKPGFVAGWAELFSDRGIKNTAASTTVLILMFVLPADYGFLSLNNEAATREASVLLNWEFAKDKIPWSLAFVIGGGATLSDGSTISGMAEMLGGYLSKLDVLPSSLVLLICIALAVFLTNFSPNTAMCNIVVPVMIEMAVVSKIHPLYLSMPVAIACGMALMTPVGTPPNAIIQAYVEFNTFNMMAAGLLPTITTILTIWIMAQSWAYIVYSSLNEFPQWAEVSHKN